MAAADASLAAKVGVAGVIVEKMRRELEPGVHWTQEAGGKVIYTPAGERRIVELLSVSQVAAEAALREMRTQPSHAFTIWTAAKEVQVPTSTGHGATQKLELVVVARIYPNRHYVRVLTPANGCVDLKVRDNRTLRLRMKIPCVLLPDGRWQCCHPAQRVKLAPLIHPSAVA